MLIFILELFLPWGYAPGCNVAKISRFPTSSPGDDSSKIWILNLSVCWAAEGETATCLTTISVHFWAAIRPSGSTTAYFLGLLQSTENIEKKFVKGKYRTGGCLYLRFFSCIQLMKLSLNFTLFQFLTKIPWNQLQLNELISRNFFKKFVKIKLHFQIQCTLQSSNFFVKSIFDITFVTSA